MRKYLLLLIPVLSVLLLVLVLQKQKQKREREAAEEEEARISEYVGRFFQTGNGQEETANQTIRRLRNEERQRGGQLHLWRESLAKAAQEASQIRTVKLTKDLEKFLDKVEVHLKECNRLPHPKGIELNHIVNAKRAYVLFRTGSYAIKQSSAAKAVLLKSWDREFKVPYDFSNGFAIRLKERDVIKIYRWNFNEISPADGIIRIGTEYERLPFAPKY